MTRARRNDVVRGVVLLALLALLWELRSVVMLLFGVVVVGAILQALAAPVARWTKLAPRTAVVVVVLLLAAAIALGLWALGEPLGRQLADLRTALPKAWDGLRQFLEKSALGARVLEALQTAGDAAVPWQRLASVATLAGGLVADLVLVIVMGLYLALDPGLYRRGAVRLVPAARRAEVDAALGAAGAALSRWLLGQGVAMLVVGVAVAAGLTLLGVPMAIALGLVAGVLEFVPFFGPIVAGLMAVLVAFGQGPQMALYVALMFIVLQQLENHLLIPLVQRWAVDLPPVLGVLAVVLFGSLFGLAGVMLGTPLMVVTLILVERLYVRRLEGAPLAALPPDAP